MREDPGYVRDGKAFQEDLSEALHEVEVELTDPQVERVYRRLSEKGALPSPAARPRRIELEELEEDAREEAVEDRVRELPGTLLRGMLRETGEELGQPLSEFEAWQTPRLRTKQLSDRLELVLATAVHSDLAVPRSAIRALLCACSQATAPVLALPWSSEGEVTLFSVGRYAGVLEGLDELLAENLEAPEPEEVAGGLEALIEEGAPPDASRPGPDPESLRVELAVLRREASVMRGLCWVQEDLAAAVDLVLGVPQSRRWAVLAGSLLSGPDRVRIWEHDLEDPPATVAAAAHALGDAHREDFELEPDPVLGAVFAERPVDAWVLGVEGDSGPFGFSVTVRDPWVPKSTIHDAVEQARRRLQEETLIPNLSADDRALLDLVQEVEERMKAEGEWPSGLDQRPPGFWSRVHERWNRGHPERQLKEGSLRGWHHRVANRVEAG